MDEPRPRPEAQDGLFPHVARYRGGITCQILWLDLALQCEAVCVTIPPEVDPDLHGSFLVTFRVDNLGTPVLPTAVQPFKFNGAGEPLSKLQATRVVGYANDVLAHHDEPIIPVGA